MHGRTEAQELGDGPGVRLEVDSTIPLATLTARLNTLCGRAEDQQDETTVLLRLGNTSPAHRAWPGPVGIDEVNRWERAVRRLEQLSTVTIAVTAVSCGGPALDLLLATDYRIGVTGMRLLLPVSDGHFWPGMAVHRLVAQIGAARARQLVLWGDEVTGDRALHLGLIDELSVDPIETSRAARVMLGRAAGPELAVRRRLLLEAASSSYEDALGAHLAACDRELRRPRDIDVTGSADEVNR